MARILLAEDDPAVREFVRRALVHSGHDVTAVDDGLGAVEALTAGTFDLLITDIVMPGGMNGIELARAAREIGACFASASYVVCWEDGVVLPPPGGIAAGAGEEMKGFS